MNRFDRDRSATVGWWSRLFDWFRPVPPTSPGVMNQGTLGATARSNQQVDTSMAVAASKSRLASVTAAYATTGAFDELIAADGNIAPHWQAVLAGLDSLTHQQRFDRMERINARVRETGIAHDLFADPSRNLQPWRLDLVPLVFAAKAWAQIEAAVIQRARLFEAMLADIYGPQETLRRGLVPPELIFNDPTYLRACQNIAPAAGRIQFFATDLARGQDGSWRVVDTHVETPAGIGYALANRGVLTQVSGDIFSASKAMCLAPFFQQMQDALAQRIGRPDPTIALLTPGPHHDDFFSHAYLARYLGFLLVEGADLRAENGRVFLKTLNGLHPIDLVVRCVAGAACDALELDPAGFLGPVGLVQALRQQPGQIVNALGTAVAENRGLGSYLPNLCKSLLGEDLAIWDVTKWWLGDARIRQDVIQNLDHYFIRRAYELTARPGRAAPAIDPARLTVAERAALIAEIELDGVALVAEEKTTLGTAPSYGENGLTAKPFALRVFATAVPGGFAVMPGGLAMTVDPGMSMALTAPDGASRDVWVLGEGAQPMFKSLWRPTLEAAQIQRSPRDLPSRAADNLFWLGRYTEQADWTLRVLRTCLGRLEEDSGPRRNHQLARDVLRNLAERDGGTAIVIPPGLDEAQGIAHMARQLLTSPSQTGGLTQTLGHVHRIAGLSRDRLSLESWRTLNAFYVGRRWQSRAEPGTIAEQLDVIDAGLRAIAAFNGLTHENMTRNFGWSFLDMGRRLSRAYNLAHVLLATLKDGPGNGDAGSDDSGRLLFVLELADSFITYRSRYRLQPMPAPVLDLLVVDETNPRSLGFQLAALAAHTDTLPQAGNGGGRTEVQRIVLALLNEVRLTDVGKLAELDGQGRRGALSALLNAQITACPQLSDALTRRYFSVFERAPQWVGTRSRQEK